MVAARHSASRILAQSQAGLYVCRSCRHQLSRPSVLIQQRLASTEESRKPENFKRRPWATDDLSKGQRQHAGEGYTGARRVQQHVEQENNNRESISRGASQSQSHSQLQTSPGSQSATESEEYVPAETWDGLEYVGSRGDWRDAPPQASDDFSAWLDSSSLVAADRAQLVSCLHQAMVECLTCNQAGLDPNSVLHMDSAQLDDRTIDAFASAKISVSQPGQLSQVHFASDAQAKEIVELLAAVDAELNGVQPEASPGLQEEAQIDAEVEAEPTNIEAESAQQGQEYPTATQKNALNYRVRDESFLGSQLNMEDPVIFTILKRFSQLAGHRIPDPALNTLFSLNKPLSFLIDQLDETVVRPKPTRLADILMTNPAIGAQSNVLIFPRRETSVDKEKEVGRWKVIERELQDRGLPTLGKLKI